MVRSFFLKYKNDILLILGLLFLCALIFIVRLIGRNPGQTVIVEMDNAVAAVFDLSANREERFFVEDDPCEYNILVIKNGQVSVSEASCPDQICVHHKKIEHEGESIVCLPHKFVVTISHEKMDGSDEN